MTDKQFSEHLKILKEISTNIQGLHKKLDVMNEYVHDIKHSKDLVVNDSDDLFKLVKEIKELIDK